MHIDSHLRRTDRFMTKDLGDEFLLYDPDGERIHILNGTAREILLLCDGRHTVEDCIAAVVRVFEIDEPTARRDVLKVLDRLTRLGAVEGGESRV